MAARLLSYAGGAAALAILITDAVAWHALSAPGDAASSSGEEVVRVVQACEAWRRSLFDLRLLLLFGLAILFLVWLVRVHKTAVALGVTGLRFGPDSIVWSFVSPLRVLWQPYLVMKELWRASGGPGAWPSRPVPPLVQWWGLAWTTTLVLAIPAPEPVDFSTYEAWTPNDFLLSIASGGAIVVSCALSAGLIRRITERLVAVRDARQRGWDRLPPDTPLHGS